MTGPFSWAAVSWNWGFFFFGAAGRRTVLISLMSHAVGAGWTCALLRWRFLNQTVPLVCNCCYLRLSGKGRGEREVRLRWYQGRGDRKPLCNHVSLEIWAEIEPAGLNSARVLLHSSCTVHLSVCIQGCLLMREHRALVFDQLHKWGVMRKTRREKGPGWICSTTKFLSCFFFYYYFIILVI